MTPGCTSLCNLGAHLCATWVHIFVQPGCTNKLLPAHGFVDSTTKGPLPDAPRSISGIQPFAIGDAITVDTPQGNAQLRVVGIARTRGAGDPASKGSALGYMSQQGLAELLNIREPNTIQIRVHTTAQAQITQARLRAVLQANHIAIVDSTLHTDSVSSNHILANLFALLRLLSIVAIVVSCFLMINTITTLLAEQISIIGTMKAIGGTQQAIFLSYLFSVVLCTIVGTLLGLFCGIAGGYALAGKLAGIHNLDLGAYRSLKSGRDKKILINLVE